MILPMIKSLLLELMNMISKTIIKKDLTLDLNTYIVHESQSKKVQMITQIFRMRLFAKLLILVTQKVKKVVLLVQLFLYQTLDIC